MGENTLFLLHGGILFLGAFVINSAVKFFQGALLFLVRYMDDVGRKYGFVSSHDTCLAGMVYGIGGRNVICKCK